MSKCGVLGMISARSGGGIMAIELDSVENSRRDSEAYYE